MVPRRAIVASVALALVRCSGASLPTTMPSPLVDAPPDPATRAGRAGPDARAVLDRALAYDRATGDMSAQLTVQMFDGESGRGFSGSGAVAVRRPDRVRLQITGPSGVTAIDLLARGDALWSRTAGGAWVTGHVFDPPVRGFPAPTVARVFLGLDWAQAAVLTEGDRPIVRVPSPDGYTLATVAREDGALLEARWFDAAGERARMRFERFETDVTGVRFPQEVMFFQRSPRVSARVVVDHRVRSPELPEQTFAVPE